jgi:rhodanese-related sulfurtransferase
LGVKIKNILFVLLLTSILFADIRVVNVTPSIVESGIKIVDIRTKSEWRETGIIKGSILITYYDEKAHYDKKHFLDILNTYVKKNEEFGIICRSGNRTSMVVKELNKRGYHVINLVGGIESILKQGYKLLGYKK